MGHIVPRHGGHGQNRHRAGIVKVNGLLIAGRQLGIQIARISAVGRHLFLGNGDFLHGVGVVGHVGQKHQNIPVLEGKLLRHRQGHIRNLHTFHRRVGGRMDKHNRPA